MKFVVVLLVFTVIIGLFMETVTVENDGETAEKPGNSGATVLGGKITTTKPTKPVQSVKN